MSRYDEPEGQKPARSSRARWAWFRRSAAVSPGRSARRRSARRRHSAVSMVLGGLAIFSAVVLVGTSLTVYVKYRLVWDSINRIDVSADLHGKRPPVDPNAINLLLIGSDSRAGENGRIGGSTGIAGARSDTVMVVHIAPGDHQVVVMSIPRDSVVPILQCSPEPGAPSGQAAQPGQVEQINSTFAYGGPGCLWETVEQTTGIHINDFVELTFVGFEKAIDALGGVEVCLPAAVDDPVSGLDLSAGRHHVYGKEALAFWRTREGVGEGDDPQRIERDQFLMAALLQGIEHSGLLHSPTKMLSVIDALTSNNNVTIDSQLTATRLLQIGEDLHGITNSSVQFVTVPWTDYAPNPDWVQWVQPGASDLFSAIAHDTALPKAAKAKKTKKTKTLQPSQVQVAVFNGSTTNGLGAATVTSLSQRGFDVVGQAADAATDTYTDSVIEYASAADRPAAQTLAAQISDVQLELDPQLGSSTLDLILGSTFTALKPAVGNSGIQNLSGTYGGITGNVNICDDQAAFAGPDGE